MPDLNYVDVVTLAASLVAAFFSVCSIGIAIYVLATLWGIQKTEYHAIPVQPQGKPTSGLEEIEKQIKSVLDENDSALRDINIDPEDLV